MSSSKQVARKPIKIFFKLHDENLSCGNKAKCRLNPICNFRLRDCVTAERMECAQKCKIEIQLYEKERPQRLEIE